MSRSYAFKRWLSPVFTMTLTYIISLSLIAILSVIVHFTLDDIIEEQTQAAKQINLSGQQRMLSQRIALFTSEYLVDRSESAKQEALRSLDKMLENHDFLLRAHNENIQNNKATQLSPEMHALYFDEPHQVNEKVRIYEGLINQSLGEYKDPSTFNYLEDGNHFLFFAKNQLLQSFDTVVQQYEEETKDRVQSLRKTQNILIVVIILTVFIAAFFIVGPLFKQSEGHTKALEHDANHDYLTKCLNRRSFHIVAERQVAMSKRNKSPLSVISVDIDDFKAINDHFGHNTGDQALKHLASLMKQAVRKSDSIFRFGGEEFLILLPETDADKAHQLAEKLRLRIEKSPVKSDSGVIHVTVSAGISEWQQDEENLDNALKSADYALYEAKKDGRNKVKRYQS